MFSPNWRPERPGTPHSPLGGGFGPVLCFQRFGRGCSRQTTDLPEFISNTLKIQTSMRKRPRRVGLAAPTRTRSDGAMAVPVPAKPGGLPLLRCRWIQYSERREITGKPTVHCKWLRVNGLKESTDEGDLTGVRCQVSGVRCQGLGTRELGTGNRGRRGGVGFWFFGVRFGLGRDGSIPGEVGANRLQECCILAKMGVILGWFVGRCRPDPTPAELGWGTTVQGGRSATCFRDRHRRRPSVVTLPPVSRCEGPPSASFGKVIGTGAARPPFEQKTLEGWAPSAVVVGAIEVRVGHPAMEGLCAQKGKKW